MSWVTNHMSMLSTSPNMSNKGFHTGLREDPKSKLYVFLVLMCMLSLVFLSPSTCLICPHILPPSPCCVHSKVSTGIPYINQGSSCFTVVDLLSHCARGIRYTTPLFMCLCNHFTLVSRPLSVVFCWKTDCTPAVLQMSTSGFEPWVDHIADVSH